MRPIITIVLFMCVFLGSCATSGFKFHPEYQGVDERATPFVNEYLKLAAINHIDFDDEVTLGFKSLNDGSTIGTCTYGWGWREIDLDIGYWNSATPTERLALTFHELTHCYCNRDHDWGEDKPYPSTAELRMEQANSWRKKGGPAPGRFTSDGCPTSFMYPIILDDDCVLHHYNHYVFEMFERCEPF